MNEQQSPDLHDARIDGVDVNFQTDTAVIYVQYYESSDSTQRIGGRITFAGLESIVQNFSVMEMKRNRSAGNISYWIPSSKFGPTHIYLAHGYISIISDPPLVERK